MVSVNNSTSGAEAHLPFGGNGKSGNGSRQSGIWVLDQFTRWQSMNWDYAGKLQKAQMDVAELTGDAGLPAQTGTSRRAGRTRILSAAARSAPLDVSAGRTVSSRDLARRCGARTGCAVSSMHRVGRSRRRERLRSRAGLVRLRRARRARSRVASASSSMAALHLGLGGVAHRDRAVRRRAPASGLRPMARCSVASELGEPASCVERRRAGRATSARRPGLVTEGVRECRRAALAASDTATMARSASAASRFSTRARDAGRGRAARPSITSPAPCSRDHPHRVRRVGTASRSPARLAAPTRPSHARG